MTSSAEYHASVIAVGTMVWFFGLVAVVIRIYSRTVLTKRRYVEDYWIIAAMVMATVVEALTWLWAANGLGKHIVDVSMASRLINLKLKYPINPLYVWTLTFVKISILTFYRRIIPSAKFRKLCNLVIAFTSICATAFSIVQFADCYPVRWHWALDRAEASHHCLNQEKREYVRISLSLAVDVIILLMPIRYLWNLSLEKRRRYNLIILFSLGTLACIASGARLFYIHDLYNANDATYVSGTIAVLSTLEINIAIVTASTPALKLFFRHYILRRRMSTPMPLSCMDQQLARYHLTTRRQKSFILPRWSSVISPRMSVAAMSGMLEADPSVRCTKQEVGKSGLIHFGEVKYS